MQSVMGGAAGGGDGGDGGGDGDAAGGGDGGSGGIAGGGGGQPYRNSVPKGAVHSPGSTGFHSQGVTVPSGRYCAWLRHVASSYKEEHEAPWPVPGTHGKSRSVRDAN